MPRGNNHYALCFLHRYLLQATSNLWLGWMRSIIAYNLYASRALSTLHTFSVLTLTNREKAYQCSLLKKLTSTRKWFYLQFCYPCMSRRTRIPLIKDVCTFCIFKSSGRNDGLKLFHTAWFTRNFVRLLQSQRDDIFSSFFFHFRMVIHPPLMRWWCSRIQSIKPVLNPHLDRFSPFRTTFKLLSPTDASRSVRVWLLSLPPSHFWEALPRTKDIFHLNVFDVGNLLWA